MRVHITLEDSLVKQLDRRVGARRRSRYIAEVVKRSLEDERRWELIESAVGAVEDGDHEWDENSADWVHQQRHSDRYHIG